MVLQAIKFLLTGVLNTAVGLMTIFFLWKVAGASQPVANFLGYVVGLCVSFFVNRRWTFESAASVAPAAARFVAVFAAAYSANVLVYLCLVRLAGLAAEVATVVAIVPYTVVFFFGSRWFVFPDKALRRGKAEPASS